MKPARKDPKPTWTHLTSEALRKADDFLSFDQLMAETKANRNQLQAALHWLQKAKVVDNVTSAEGLYWFLTGQDTRIREQEERVQEEPGTRRKRVRKAQPPKDS